MQCGRALCRNALRLAQRSHDYDSIRSCSVISSRNFSRAAPLYCPAFVIYAVRIAEIQAMRRRNLA